MKKAKRLLVLLLAMLMLATVFTGCGSDKATKDSATTDDSATTAGEGSTTADNGSGGDTLVVLSSGAFQGTWDPTGNTILSNKHLEWNVFEHLVHKDADGNYIPGLAASWEYLDDGYTLQLTLRQGVTFHDGSAFNAEDVAATVAWTSRPDSAAYGDWGCVFETEIVDDYTIKMWPTTKAPCAELLDLLCSAAVLSADDVNAGTLNQTLNGNGAYQFVKYENETVYLKAFDNYWDKDNAAKMEYCEYKYVAEPATRLAALQTGEAHLIERVDIEQVAQIEADDTIAYQKVYVDEQKYIIFKCTQDVMQQELVRKAISYAIDRETIVNDIMQGYAVLADSYTSHVNPMYVAADGLPTYDPEKAAQLLAEAGYPNGEGLPTIKYITSTGFYPKTKEYAEYIVSNLNAIGIQVELVVEETAAWEQHLYEEDSCLMIDTGWMNCSGATNFILGNHYRTTGRCNFSSYPEVDAALDKESAITVPEERRASIQNDLYPLLVETNTNMPLFDSVQVYGYVANLQGLTVTPSSNINFAALSLS
ncbi:MAG: ABC transporter substrate-binding protein [Oscillospiraceae bacterium]|nr:ABC transporter substrate-binding protein [Oscillospiraceae bacterium]